MARGIYAVITLPLEKFREILQCPGLEIYLQESWGSLNPEHRQKIREFIAKKIPAHSHHSISHCKQMGVIATSPINLGVDIEEIARVSLKVVERMSNGNELKNAKDPASLWAAKESSFKALLNYKQPLVVSRLEIGDWQSVDSQIDTFKLLNNHEFAAPLGQGLVFRSDLHIISIFVFPA